MLIGWKVIYHRIKLFIFGSAALVFGSNAIHYNSVRRWLINRVGFINGRNRIRFDCYSSQSSEMIWVIQRAK